MDFMAIVERRTTHRHVSIPALGTSGAVPHSDDPRAFAGDLAAAATGLPAADIRVTLLDATLGETVVQTSPVDIEVRHDDGTWRTARQTGWLRQWHGSWGPLVAYTADGMSWTRGVHISRVRRPSRAPVTATSGEPVPMPRTMAGAGSVNAPSSCTALVSAGQGLGGGLA